MKPFSEACERNRARILAVQKRVFRDRKRVLEIGSGTGQHAAYFTPELPHLAWQASDVAEYLPGIRRWVGDGVPPIELDVDKGVCRLLPAAGLFALYGPVHYGGRAMYEGNTRFDAMLRARDPASGVRNFEDLDALARRCGLALLEDNAMPANNRLLVFRKAN